MKPRREEGSEYEEAVKTVSALMRDLAPKTNVPTKGKSTRKADNPELRVYQKYFDHERGNHPCLNCGVTMGGGDPVYINSVRARSRLVLN